MARRTPPDRAGHRCSPRLALRVEEAAEALGISDASFTRYVRDHVACVRLGSLRLYPVPELERFLAERAEPVLGNGDRQPVADREAAPRAGPRRPVGGR